jgi:hypothetical protein
VPPYHQGDVVPPRATFKLPSLDCAVARARCGRHRGCWRLRTHGAARCARRHRVLVRGAPPRRGLAVCRHAAPHRRGPLPRQSAYEREREWMCEREGDKCRRVIEDYLYVVYHRRRGLPLRQRLLTPPRQLQMRERLVVVDERERERGGREDKTICVCGSRGSWCVHAALSNGWSTSGARLYCVASCDERERWARDLSFKISLQNCIDS